MTPDTTKTPRRAGTKGFKAVSLYLITLVEIPAVILLGMTLFKGTQYAFIALAVAVLACVPFLMSFEKDQDNGKLIMVVAVMIAISSAGRLLFAAVPHFKPVTALVVITAIYFGPQAGFVTGAMTAAVSNFSFGQGPWTPFQMFSWGLIGLIAGLAGPLLCKRTPVGLTLLAVYGVFSGVLYSIIMDTWTTLWLDNGFNVSRYLANLLLAAPTTAVYAVSNVVFLLALTAPVGRVFQRIQRKYGIRTESAG